MDLRQWKENPVKHENKKKVFLSSKDSKNTENITINLAGQIEKAAEIYHTWQNEGTVSEKYAVPELYRSVKVYDSQLTDEERKTMFLQSNQKDIHLLRVSILSLLTMI